MRYIVGLERTEEIREGNAVISQVVPAHLEIRDTDKQHAVELICKMPTQPGTKLGKEYTPTGVLSFNAHEIYVGTKFGFTRFGSNGLLVPFNQKGSSLESLVSEEAKLHVPNDGTCSCTFAAVSDVVYWLPTIKLGNKRDQQALGLFHLTDEGIKPLSSMENIPIVGPLLSFHDLLFFYVEKDSAPTQRKGMLYCKGKRALYMARSKDAFSFELYPQPVALCTDDEFVYSAGTVKGDIIIHQFNPHLELKSKISVSLNSISDLTAFAIFNVGYTSPNISGILESTLSDTTYALLGGTNGTLALVDITSSKRVAELDILDRELREYIGPTPYVRNILVAQGIDDADILVQYTNATVHLKASDLLTTAFYLCAHGDPDALLRAPGYTHDFKNNQRVAVFPTSITCSGVL